MTTAEDPIPISALNQFAYCPRRCYLIHAEGEFRDNVHTASGTREHERVDQSETRAQAGVRIARGLPVGSEALGLSGRCDVVEFHSDGSIYPVEYKHGRRRQSTNDDWQLVAQALCLEEMTGTTVRHGAIFHQQSKRRREVAITAELRAAVTEAVAAIRELLSQTVRPPVLQGADAKRCGECSLREICEPELTSAAAELTAIAAGLFEPESEDV